jgi:hypothetical protein
MIVFKAAARAFFAYGFAKKERDNIRDDELTALKILAEELFAYDDVELAGAVRAKFLIEVARDNA